MCKTITEYDKLLKEMIATKNPYIISNDGYECAAYVLSNIFKSSKKTVRIFSECLDSTVTNHPVFKEEWDKLIKRVKTKEINLQILLEKKPTSEVYGMIKNSGICKIAGESFKNLFNKEAQSKDGDKGHFTTGDNQMVRKEYNSKEFLASCCFYSPEYVEILNKVFDNEFKQARYL